MTPRDPPSERFEVHCPVCGRVAGYALRSQALLAAQRHRTPMGSRCRTARMHDTRTGELWVWAWNGVNVRRVEVER